MLFAATVLLILAAALFLLQAMKEAWVTLTTIGLALFAAGMAVWAIDALHEMGKF